MKVLQQVHAALKQEKYICWTLIRSVTERRQDGFIGQSIEKKKKEKKKQKTARPWYLIFRPVVLRKARRLSKGYFEMVKLGQHVAFSIDSRCVKGTVVSMNDGAYVNVKSVHWTIPECWRKVPG